MKTAKNTVGTALAHLICDQHNDQQIPVQETCRELALQAGGHDE